MGEQSGGQAAEGDPERGDLHENDCVAIDVQEDQITLRKLPRRKTLDDLFAGYQGGYKPAEFETGADVGREVFD